MHTPNPLNLEMEFATGARHRSPSSLSEGCVFSVSRRWAKPGAVKRAAPSQDLGDVAVLFKSWPNANLGK